MTPKLLAQTVALILILIRAKGPCTLQPLFPHPGGSLLWVALAGANHLVMS